MVKLTVSVVIPLYNKEDRVRECLSSLFKQTQQPDEIIVVDDGSTDSSLQAARDMLDKCSGRTKLLRQSNAGAAAARNAGLAAASSELVAFLDADDEWAPEFLERMASLIQDFPGAALYGCAHISRYVEDGKKVQGRTVRPFVRRGYRGIVRNFFYASLGGSVVNCSKSIVRKSALMELGGFPEGVVAGEDLIVWMRLSMQHQIAYEDIPSVTIHVEPDASRNSRVHAVPYPLTYYSNHGLGELSLAAKLYLRRIFVAHQLQLARLGDGGAASAFHGVGVSLFPVFARVSSFLLSVLIRPRNREVG